MFAAYPIKDTDMFLIDRYPEVGSELFVICKHLNDMKGDHKAEIVISFLKDHSIRTAWFTGNDDVVKMITSGFLKTNHSEALFASCRHNRAFADDFERYISSLLVK
jgi:hypothetical protein